MAITVSGGNPTLVTVASGTVTTNTTFNANAPNDRDYIFADNIIGTVNTGITVGGFGLFLQSTHAAGSVAMTNNGSVVINELTDALALEGNGGTVTYAGSGIITNTGAGRALFLDNSNGGNITAVINNDITANTASAIVLDTAGAGVATLTQAAGTLVSNAVAGDNVIDIFAQGGVVAHLNGTITGGSTAVRAQSNGAITINSSGDIDANEDIIVAIGDGSGRVTVNISGGEVHADFGIAAIANGNGGAVVNLTGGQVGSAGQIVSENGLRASSNGTSGNVAVTTSAATTIFAGTGILADINDEDSIGNINVTVNGTIDLAFFGVFADNLGTGTTSITINGSVLGNTGIRTVNGAASVFNAGTVTGTGGTAIDLGPGNDRLTITRTSVINGDVLANGGNDTLRLAGGGTGNFNVDNLGQQYQGFETFNVVSGSWLLTGNSGENWNVLGGTLGGTASINVLTVFPGGTVAPGASAGRLEAGQLFLTAGARVAIEIGGTAAGQFDQIEVDGNVVLGGATLNLSRINGFVPSPGTSFLIIDHDAAVGPVVGTFAGLPEGADIFNPGTGAYRISYAGGDGNDVTLTALAFVAQGSGDFNGNGADDLLWRNGQTGELLRWTITDNQVEQISLGNLDLSLAVVGIGDFDGNGTEDLVYRRANGELLVDGASRGILDNVLAVAGVGDFNGDGRDELVYRHLNGELFVDGVSLGILDNVFAIAAIGDFDGDGRDEFVYRRSNGEVLIDGASIGVLDNIWTIEGVGDFNGDGEDELVIRHANGEVRIDGNSIGVVDNALSIEFIGDFDHNGTDDLLWRHVNGSVLLNGNTIGHLDVF